MGLDKYRISNPNETETLKFYNENNQSLGTVNREEGIKKGLLLEAVQLWVINPNTNQVLMQKRSKNKTNNPGKIDVSVSGHVKPDETPTQAMLREAREEIGLKDSEGLYRIMNKIAEDKINLADFGGQGRYIIHFYMAFLTDSLESYTKQDSEVDELFFMDYDELKRRVRDGDKDILIPNSRKAETIFSLLDKKIQERKLDKHIKEK